MLVLVLEFSKINALMLYPQTNLRSRGASRSQRPAYAGIAQGAVSLLQNGRRESRPTWMEPDQLGVKYKYSRPKLQW